MAVDIHLLEIEDRLSCIARQLESTGNLYLDACEKIEAADHALQASILATAAADDVDTPYRQDLDAKKRAFGNRMHVQSLRLRRHASLFPTMSHVVMALRKRALQLQGRPRALASPGGRLPIKVRADHSTVLHAIARLRENIPRQADPGSESDLPNLLTSLETVDALLVAIFAIGKDELQKTAKCIEMAFAS